MSNLQSFSWPRKSFNLPWPSPNPLSALLLLCPSSKTTYQRWQNITQNSSTSNSPPGQRNVYSLLELPYLKLLRMENTLQYNTVYIPRFMKGCRKTWQPFHLWWRKEEEITTISTQRMWAAASIYKHLYQEYTRPWILETNVGGQIRN